MLLASLTLCLLLKISAVGGVRHFGNRESTHTLYSGNNPVVQLHNNNFTQLLTDGDTAWVVEFYASWCGHCQRFARTWVSLANSVRGWMGVIQVAALACSHPDNVAVCRQYDVQSYPSIKFFPPSAGSSPVGERYGGEEDNSKIRMAMVDYIESLPHPPDTWPQLQALHNLLSLIEEARGDVDALVLFEDTADEHDEKNYLARQVILDFSAYSTLVIGRMSRIAGSNHGLTEFPSLCRANADGSLALLSVSSSRKELGDVIHQHVLQDYSSTTLRPAVTWSSTTVMPVVPDALHIQDVESSVFYSLWQEVARHKTISGELMQALSQHVTVMAKYYPGKQYTALFLKRLQKWLSSVESVTGERWLNNLNKLQTTEAYVPHLVVWTGCHGSQPQFRGYPCSLWSTYHMLTVHAYMTGEQGAAKEVLLTMRDFVRHYLSCHECAVHFAKMAAEMDTLTDNNEDGVLWLWRAHNRVNDRLHGDTTEDTRHPKVQFPVYSACPDCHSKSPPSSNYVSSQWQDGAILEYLVQFYSDNVVDDTKAYTYIDVINRDGRMTTESQQSSVSNRYSGQFWTVLSVVLLNMLGQLVDN